MALDQRTWRKAPQHTLHWQDWGGDSVVFDSRSGQTHQLEPLAASVMAYFEQSSWSLAHLATVVAADLDSAVDNDLHSALTATVEQFHRLGWIEPIDHA